MFYAFGPNTPIKLREHFNRYAASKGLMELPVSIGTFPGGEPFCEIGHGLPENEIQTWKNIIAGQKVAFIQSMSDPVSLHAMQTLIATRTFKRYGAGEVIIAHPFEAFARQEKNTPNNMESISMDDYAFLLKAAGADEVITIEMHSRASEDMLQNHFGTDKTHFLSMHDYFASHMIGTDKDDDTRVGAPDGADKPDDAGQRRAKRVHHELYPQDKAETKIFKSWKQRTGVGQSKLLKFEGDVNGKICNIIDDMADSGGTLIGIANTLKDAGAKETNCYITHAILPGGALERLMTARRTDGSYTIDNLIVSDTCPDITDKIATLQKQYPSIHRRITVIDTSEMMFHAVSARLQNKPITYGL